MIYWKLKATYKRGESDFEHVIEGLSDNPIIEDACEELKLRIQENYPDSRNISVRLDVDADSHELRQEIERLKEFTGMDQLN